MSADDRRRAALLQLRGMLQAAGRQPLPDPDVLERVVQTGAYVDHSSLVPWRRAVEEVLTQVKFGVTDPVGHLDPALLEAPPAPAPSQAEPPAGAPTTSSGAGNGTVDLTGGASREQKAFDALVAWRAEGLAGGDAGFGGLKDSQVRSLIRSGIRDLDRIRKVLPPGSLRGRADEVLRILRAHDPRDGSDAPTVAPDGLSEPTATAATAPMSPPVPSLAPAGPEQAAPAVPIPGAGAPVVLDPASFDLYDLFGPKGEPGPMTVGATATGGWNLQWRDPDAEGFVVYRVVSNDEFAPYAPESGELLAVTQERRVLDDRPFVSAVRHYQVWRNSGPDQAAAVGSQPVLVAATSVVGQVTAANVGADAGRVIGQWEAPADVDHVQVYRVPIKNAGRADLLPEFRILPGAANLEGFIDSTVTRGARYLYLISCAADVDGVVRLSVPVRFEVAVSAVLEGVGDLDVQLREDAGSTIFDLSWTDPSAGRVQVYRSKEPPRAGAATKARQTSALTQMKLEETDRLPNPVVRNPGGLATMAEVPCPDGWTRAYFTPVTVLDDMAQVGETVSATFVPPVRLPRIVERVDRQVLTFAWPEGAASVVAYVAARGASADAARLGRQCEIFRRQYEDLGGLSIPFLLPEVGCSVHVVPVAFSGGEKIEGTTVSLEYPGLLRLRYATNVKRGLTGRPQTLIVDITSDVQVGPPPFVLVHGPDRLPLHVSDGVPLEAVRDGDETMATTRRPCPDQLVPGQVSRWRFDVKKLSGFVRLFVDLPPAQLRRVALLDPPLASLRLGAGVPGRS